MSVVRRFLAEPLTQFLMIGALVFGLWSWLDRSPPAQDEEVIEIGPGRIAQLHETFRRSWQRPPTEQELSGLIDAFVKEEIFYREGVKMGLDRDDTVLRRRMQQKMEFLMEPDEADLTATDEQLETYLSENAQAFRMPMRIAFRHVFFDPARHGDRLEMDMAELLERLSEESADQPPPDAGDPTLLPPSVPLSPLDRVAAGFGDEFANAIAVAPVGRWTGPVVSTFGLHLVFVEERAEARVPALDEVRGIVIREWQSSRRRAVAEERYRQLRANYQVTVTPPDAALSTAADE